ncbi:MAG: alpha/beta hydrolase [Clostridium sp.]
MLGYVILGVAALGIAGFFIFTWLLSSKVIHPMVKNYKDTYRRCVSRKCLDENLYNSWNRTDFFVESNYEYNLSCQLLEDDNHESLGEKIKIMVLVHGITWSKYSSIKYADMFIKNGFKVLMYDHRNHGLSGKAPTTMGYYEKYDLKSVIDWCYKTFGKDIYVATHGESMGSATVLAHLEIDERPEFVIADCGYSDLSKLLEYQLKQRYHLPSFPFVPVAAQLVKIRAGFNIKDVSPIKVVANTDKPILFIHGDSDDYVPTHMGRDMFEAKKDKKELYIVPKAKHAEALVENTKEYEKVVNDFLNKYFNH